MFLQVSHASSFLIECSGNPKFLGIAVPPYYAHIKPPAHKNISELAIPSAAPFWVDLKKESRSSFQHCKSAAQLNRTTGKLSRFIGALQPHPAQTAQRSAKKAAAFLSILRPQPLCPTPNCPLLRLYRRIAGRRLVSMFLPSHPNRHSYLKAENLLFRIPHDPKEKSAPLSIKGQAGAFLLHQSPIARMQ